MASGYGTIRDRQLTFKNSYMECSVSSGYRLSNETKCKKLEKKTFPVSDEYKYNGVITK